MMRIVARPLLVLLLTATAGLAQSAELGRIEFPTSGAEAAQPAFIRGVLLLHSFEYEDAREAFREARRIDPDFALAYWGEAMTHNHPLWAQQDREAALDALKALAPTREKRLAKAGSDVERGLLAAVETLYGEGEKGSRDRAYREAMRRLHEAHPEDLEVASFYALSVLGSVRQRDFRTYMQAGAIAEEVFARNPLHPGAAHYLIHSYDDPVHAPLGLRAARVYAEIAPAASHAQHMISHIYTALGRWDEVIDANRKSVEVSEERLRRKEQPLHRRNHHSLYWLEYALLQQGRFEEARALITTMAADAAASPSTGNLWHYARMRAAFVVADPSRPDPPPAIELPEVSLGAVVNDHFASALLALEADDRGSAGSMLEAIRGATQEAREEARREGAGGYGATSEDELAVAEIVALELEGLLALAAGKSDRGVTLLAKATAAEEGRALEFGPPSVVKPSHELLGEVLLELDRPAEAQNLFAAALERAPRRTLSLVGLVRAAEAAGDSDTARESRRALGEIWKGDGELVTGVGGGASGRRKAP